MAVAMVAVAMVAVVRVQEGKPEEEREAAVEATAVLTAVASIREYSQERRSVPKEHSVVVAIYRHC